MIDFEFKVCYDFTGVTEEELNKLSAQDIMLHQCIIDVRVLLERPLESVYLLKVEHFTEGVLSHYWMYTNDSTGMEVVSVRQLLDTPVPFNYNKHQIFIL